MRTRKPKKPTTEPRTRKDIFQSLWIPVSVRMPPDDISKILISTGGSAQLSSGQIVCAQLHQRENGLVKEYDMLPGTGYFATHWMYVWGMDDA